MGMLDTFLNRGKDTITYGILKGIYDAATLPGDVYQGNVRPDSPEALDRAMGMVDFASGGAFPAAVARSAVRGVPRDMVSMFGGMFSDTADRNALKEAMDLKLRGTSDIGIWDRTGWYKGVDDKWRYEIPTQNAKLRSMDDFYDWDRGSPITDLLDFPELYKAYPDLRRNVDVEIRDDIPYAGSYGAAFPSGGHIDIHPDFYNLETFLHELQHGIQTIEGYAPGTNPTYLDEQFTRKALEEYGEADPDDIWRLAKEAYRREAGEVEARNVETRIPYVAEERATIPPWFSQDVPRKQQIHTPQGLMDFLMSGGA
jgi:hypothetical protein